MRRMHGCIAAVAAAGLVLGLGGCMHGGVLGHPMSRAEARELHKASKGPFTIILVSGEKIHAEEYVGRTCLGCYQFMVIETPGDKHALVRMDQIAAIKFADGEDEEQGEGKDKAQGEDYKGGMGPKDGDDEEEGGKGMKDDSDAGGKAGKPKGGDEAAKSKSETPAPKSRPRSGEDDD